MFSNFLNHQDHWCLGAKDTFRIAYLQKSSLFKWTAFTAWPISTCVFLSADPISWAAPLAHDGQASEPASHTDEKLGSAEVELVRKTKAESSPSGEANANHVSDGQTVKLENAQNGDASTTWKLQLNVPGAPMDDSLSAFQCLGEPVFL